MDRTPQSQAQMRGPEIGGSVSTKVAEVFMTAGLAFQKLADLTLQLNSAGENEENMKWSETDIEQLKEALGRFSGDLENISRSVQSKTTKQIKLDLKRKAILGEDSRPRSDSPVVRSSGGPSSIRKQPASFVSRRGRGGGNVKSYAAAATPRPAIGGQPPVNVFMAEDTDSFAHPEIGPPSF